MSVEPIPWLPRASQAEVDALVRRVAEDWLADWVETAGPIVVAASERVEEDALSALGRLACGGRADAENAADRKVLTRVGAVMRDDLMARLGGVGEGDRRWRIASQAPDWSVSIALSEQRLIDLRRRMAGSSRRPAVASVMAALADTNVTLGCHLGRATISAGELSALGPGDVLILDRSFAAPTPLTVAGTISGGGRAAVRGQDGMIAVEVLDATDVTRSV